ncbi:MAG: hypothetical protein Q8O14_01350 [bacterium]|jgi:hypothetical protein|nr:hypothetical protein [bacterium]
MRRGGKGGARALPVLALLALAACSRLEESAPRAVRPDQPEQLFLDARVEFLEGGMVRGEAMARRMDQHRRSSLVRMVDSVEVVSWDSLGRAESLTLCDTLHYRRDRQDITALGNVRMLAASDPQGRRLDLEPGTDLAALRRRPPFLLRTRRLDWVQRIQKIQSEESVVFVTPYDTLHGVGFRSDRNLRNWEIGEPVGVTHRATGDGRRRASSPAAPQVMAPPSVAPTADQDAR